jgi:hypothetical protein
MLAEVPIEPGFIMHPPPTTTIPGSQFTVHHPEVAKQMACFVVVVSALAFTESEHTAKDTITRILLLKTNPLLNVLKKYHPRTKTQNVNDCDLGCVTHPRVPSCDAVRAYTRSHAWKATGKWRGNTMTGLTRHSCQGVIDRNVTVDIHPTMRKTRSNETRPRRRVFLWRG